MKIYVILIIIITNAGNTSCTHTNIAADAANIVIIDRSMRISIIIDAILINTTDTTSHMTMGVDMIGGNTNF